MADEHHVALLRRGVDAWNNWRRDNPAIGQPDLASADLNATRLSGANLNGARLNRAAMRNAEIIRASFIEADLRNADFSESNLMGTDFDKSNLNEALFDRADMRETGFWGSSLKGASFIRANLMRGDFTRADLTGADLTEAQLSYAIFVDTNLERANINASSIYGISVWNVNLTDTSQKALVITDRPPIITVDDLQVAQFVFLLLRNEKIRDVIDTIGKKAVLILGRFTPERKTVLNAIREELRKRGYLPMLFDFDQPSTRDLTETISTLAHLSRFIIADITDAKSIPQELQAIVPNLPSVVVRPIIAQDQKEYAMFEHFRRYPWVLPVYEYRDADQLLGSFEDEVIRPVESKVHELAPPR